MQKRIIVLGVLMMLLTLLGGCTSMQARVKPEEFGQDKTYALVSIVAAPQLINYSSNQSSSLSGLVKAVGSERGFTESSRHSLDASVVRIRKQLAGSHAFRLLPEGKMMRNRAFKALPQGEQTVHVGMFPVTTLSARGYANLGLQKGTATEAGKLATALGVDGVIIVQVNYGYGFGGVNVAGLVSAGKHNAIVAATVTAFNRHGELVWQETVQQKSAHGIPTIGESVNFRKLRPLLVETAEQAMLRLVSDLENRLTAT